MGQAFDDDARAEESDRWDDRGAHLGRDIDLFLSLVRRYRRTGRKLRASQGINKAAS